MVSLVSWYLCVCVGEGDMGVSLDKDPTDIIVLT